MTPAQLLAALREEAGPVTADALARRVGEPTQSVARMLSWMQRHGQPVVRSPRNVARAYARLDGAPPPTSSVWRAV